MASGFIYHVAILFSLLCLCIAEDITINTRLGQIVGTKDAYEQKTVSIFYNIPFAKPPVGDLRFAQPVPYGNWTGTLNATVFGNQCMQRDNPVLQFLGVESSEDCLNLNIYVPNNVNESSKKPVMVWIHGGGFTSGLAQIYDSRPLALHGNVIVVTIQYRLGIFGFFSLGKTEALGNYGIWDQMLALEWVHQNIDSFGGDPTSVTIFGQSAGGASVSLLSLIPRNRNRFHRVIAQSGTMTVPWAMTNATEASYAIGELVGCSRSLQTTAFVRCLQSVNSSTLFNSYWEYSYRDPYAFPSFPEIGPVIDGELFKIAPASILKNHSSEEYQFFSSLDFMTGTLKADGDLVLISMTEAFQKHHGFNLTTGVSFDEFCDIIVSAFTRNFFKNNAFVFRKICDEYQSKNNVSEQSRQMVELFTDFPFVYPAFESLHHHSQDNIKANTFHYVFELDGPPLTYLSPPDWFIGPGHGYELRYLFPVNPPSSEEWKYISSVMMAYWTNFAKNGDPNHSSLTNWPMYDNQKEGYLAINSIQSTMMKYKKHRIEFWGRDIPYLMKSAPTGTVTIPTKLGLMIGNINYLNNDHQKKVLTFYNIPFAKPPVGDLRFAQPVPYGNWTGTLNATVFGNQCMQRDNPVLQFLGVESSEDCLNLNIYVPNNVNESSKKPVMVWIHGGGFTSGLAQIYDSRPLALHGNVIVVTIQYRLGIFGFFSLGKTEALGNYGIWDQMLALEWVHQNIDSFGGDPTSVTIFGQSAGGASVSLLSLIPRNRNRFHRVIAQSGTMTVPWAMTNATEASYAIGELVGCSRSLQTTAFVRCLQSVNSSTLFNSYWEYSYRDPYAFPSFPEIGPVIDGELFKIAPASILKNHSSEEYQFFSSLDFMTGTLKADGDLVLISMTEAFQKHHGFNLTTGVSFDEFCDIIVSAFTRNFFKNNAFVFRKICDEYQSKNNVSEQSRQMVELFTDFPFVYPAFESLHHHSQDNIKANTFHYVFELDGPPLTYLSPPDWFIGPGHGYELRYLFPVNPPSSEEWKYISSVMMAYWTNFAKNGDPNHSSLTNWPMYDNQKEGYLAINSIQSTMMKYKKHRIEFWGRDIPYLMKSAPTGTVTIPTKLGLMIGNINYLNNDHQKKVLTFYNIPFAKPPVGDLRFAQPVPYGNWTGTLNATVFGNQCMQRDNPVLQFLGVESSEDCLNLNIYVPNNIDESSKKPVMVWIHGGGFTSGLAQIYDSRPLALHGNVIVVTIQYRLGIFGFFSLGKTEALGNYGIWDQMLALEWVHQNIDSFGGDPTSVTIFGQSAGGASVSLLSLIPRNRNRFHRVIAQSGTMTVPWAMTNATEASYVIGELVGCSRSLQTTAFVRCLQSVNSNTLRNNYLQYTDRYPNAFSSVAEIGPVIDGELFRLAPESLLKIYSSEEYQFFSSLDFMTGTVKADGNYVLLEMSESLQNITVSI
ncbi:uncharacterized protein LOC125647249 [Ostrea edulis]|uniref:uncharacterized protein LOC125647249 n=1 Tax=Ostrea edulis TaxID=37623 RepID=UPI0024AF8194|nr:uncharacterized protein LOC125647249 [Ostrea edulis]